MNATMYQPLPYNQMLPFQCAMNQRMILSHQEISILLYYVHTCSLFLCYQIMHILHHACLVYEKCNVDRVGKMPSNITV